MGRIRNAWELSKSSWQVLSKDRELIAIPVISGIFAILGFLIVASPGFLLLSGSDENSGVNAASYIFFILGSVVAAFYYLRLLKVMWFDAAPGQVDKAPGEAQAVAIGAAIFSFPVVLGALVFLDPLAKAAALAFGLAT